MAAPHVFVTYSIQDGEGKVSVSKINFPIDNDLAVIQHFIVSTATMINAIITGKIIEAGLGLSVDLGGATIRATPDADSDVMEGARFIFRAASNALAQFRLPTFDEGKLVSGTAEVNTSDSDVSAFTARITGGLTEGLTNVSPSDDRGSDLETLESARESWGTNRS